MGKKKGKGSRKGKKEWRANISTDEIEDFFEKSTKDALSGGQLSNVPTESLFYVDSSRELKVMRKTEKKKEEVLWCDSILRKNPFVQSVPSSKGNAKNNNKKMIKNVEIAAHLPQSRDGGAEESMADLWRDEDDLESSSSRLYKNSNVPAVEIEPPGCSYNPDHEAHQDSLAQAVAEEMHKVYRDELGPQPVPLVPAAKVIDEEEIFFLDVDEDVDDDINSNDQDLVSEKRAAKAKRVTRVELNKRAKRKEELRKEASLLQKKKFSEAIEGIPQIMQEIAEEDAERNKKRMRRLAVKQELMKTRPPRLGKQKFVPAPTQVLLSEEINGSLRKLKGCCTLLRDRFKSIEKRGLIPPSSKTKRR